MQKKPLTDGNISIKQADGECIVTLPTATKWSATLYGSNGAIVASKAGEGRGRTYPFGRRIISKVPNDDIGKSS